MPTTEPIQAGPYYLPADPPDIPTATKGIVDWAARRLVMRFASTTARDAAITTPVEGEVAVTGTGASLVTWQYRDGGWKVMRAGMYRIGAASMGAASASVTATELTVATCTVTSPSGSIRLTLAVRLDGTAGDVFLVRVRNGSTAGGQLAAFYAYITSATRVSVSGSDYATIAANTSTELHLTLQRFSGSAGATMAAGSRIIVDEDPV